MITFVKDCLGSVRSVVDLSDGTVLEQNDYYAYGERVDESTMQTTSINRWRYNGKEEQDSIASIPYLDYGARLYDPVIGRWMQQDPMAAMYPHLSPYNFCGDNPAVFVDPDGNWIYVFDNAQRYKYDNNRYYKYSGLDDNGSEVYNEFTPEKGTFLDYVLEALNLGSQYKTGKELIDFFSNDKNDAFIHTRDLSENKIATNTSYNAIYLQSNGKGTKMMTEYGVEVSNFWIDVFHELAHRMDYLTRGKEAANETWVIVPVENGKKRIFNTEIQATHFENRLRSEADLPLRTHYSIDVTTGMGYEPTRLINKKGYSLFINDPNNPKKKFNYRSNRTKGSK